MQLASYASGERARKYVSWGECEEFVTNPWRYRSANSILSMCLLANNQEEMTIRAMTCHGRRRKHCHRHNSSSGGEESRTDFSRQGGPCLTPTRTRTSDDGRHLGSSRSSSRGAESATARGSGRSGGTEPEQSHGLGAVQGGVPEVVNASGDVASKRCTALPRRRSNKESAYPGGGSDAGASALSGTTFAPQNATAAAAATDVVPIVKETALFGSLTSRSGSWGAGIGNGHRGSSGESNGRESGRGER